jgi:DNA-binding NarL/FixJ family response regulator
MADPSKIRLLIVDDHYFVRLGLKDSFTAQDDMEVVAEASTAPQARELFRSQRPDVCIVDLILPGENGLELTRSLVREDPAARIIMISTFQGVEDVYGAFRAGARSYLLKSMEPETFVEAIRAVRAGRNFVPPQIAEILGERLRRPEISPREREVLVQVALGLSNKEIAAKLSITEGTVKLHVHKLLEKLGVSDRTQAATAAIQQGLVR